ncbi:MAG: PAS domain S-box protein [Thermoflexibacter sp.]|nr:PAS domain S-box protein [Thermoflexibacter sp.]
MINTVENGLAYNDFAGSEDLLQAIFDSSFYALVIMDTDLRVRALNQQAVDNQHLYFNRKVNIGDYVGDFVLQENKQEIISQLSEVIAGKIIRQERKVLGKLDNQRYWFDITISPIYNKDKTVLGICYGAINITDRKLAEEKVEKMLAQEQMLTEELNSQNEELQQNLEELNSTQNALYESQQNLQAIFNSNLIGIVVYDRNFKILRINRKAHADCYKISGLDLKEDDSMELLSVSKEDRLYFLEASAQAFKGKTVRSERRFTAKRKEIWVDVIFTPVLSRQQEVECVVFGALDISERKKAEMEVRHTKEQLQNIFDTLDEIFWSYDISRKKLLLLSPAFEKILGYRVADFIKYRGTLQSIVHIEDRPTFEAAMLQATEQGKEAYLEYRVYTIDNQVRWVQSHIKPYFGVSLSYPTQLEGFTTDITARKQAELALKESEANLRATFNSSRQIFYLIDKNYRIEGFNKLAYENAKEITGIILKQGDSILEQMNKWGFGEFAENFIKTLGGEVVTYEKRLNGQSQREQWYEVTYYPVTNDYGVIDRVVFNAQSIAARKEAEKALVESERNFRSVFEQAAAGIFQLDFDKNVIQCNDTFSNMIGYSLDEIKGKGLWAIIQPDYASEAEQVFDQVVREELESFRAESRYLHKDGHVVWVLVTISLVRDINERPKYILGIVQNITELKRMQEDLIFKKNELDTFLYRTPHDLRGPVATLKGLNSIVKLEVQEPSIGAYLKNMERTVNQLDNIITNLMEITKIKESEIIKEVVDFHAVINDCINAVRELPKFAQVDFRTHINVKQNIRSDIGLLRIILQNLIENAINYARNRVDSFVDITVEETDFGNIKLIVADNGEGIPEQYQGKIFNMFFRGTESSKGSGLGLYILKNALDKLNGTINVESAYGKGSKFTVFLPK